MKALTTFTNLRKRVLNTRLPQRYFASQSGTFKQTKVMSGKENILITNTLEGTIINDLTNHY
jgi:hypothetical protein